MVLGTPDNQVSIFEVGPRDGLQSLPNLIPTASKIELIDALAQTGLRKIEATSFVNPKWVPQLADGPDVMARLPRRQGVSYAALTPNLRGVQSALNARCDESAVFISASEGFSQANINCTIEQSINTICPAITLALKHALPVRGYVSCIVECPFDGPTAPQAVVKLTQTLLDLGCYEVSLGDTLGTATPQTLTPLFDLLFAEIAPTKLAGHFHDTYGHALSNVDVALDYGIRTFDSSVAGLGGCPYAPGASGNVDTRMVVEHVHNRGFQTGVDLDQIKTAEIIALRTVSDI